MPETVFFKDDGKIDFMVTMDRDLCLTLDRKGLDGTSSSTNTRNKLENAVKERHQDTEPHGR